MSFLSGNSSALPSRRPRPLGVDENKLSTNERARPVPYVAGKNRIAVTFISDVFDVKKDAVTRDVGKQKTRTGTSYFFSFAALVGHGPFDGIHAVLLNGETVWGNGALEGDLNRGVDHPVFVDITIPDYGLIRFYWGTDEQEPDAYLNSRSGVQHPAYRGFGYIVAHQLFAGFNQSNIQNLEVIVSRFPEFGSSPPIIDAISANPINVLVDWLLSPRLGRGFDSAWLDVADLEAVGTQVAGERLGISPVITTQKDAIQWIVHLLEYIDGFPRISPKGLLSIGLVRPGYDVDELPVVDESVMMEPLNITPEDYSSAFNETNIRFTDPTQNYDPNSKT
ncbi:MAG TPA: hypothetical protein VGQ71_01150, partial [Terriglobales bacterium]|nr:hypothetical protein [Terriglobales bacterium]